MQKTKCLEIFLFRNKLIIIKNYKNTVRFLNNIFKLNFYNKFPWKSVTQKWKVLEWFIKTELKKTGNYRNFKEITTFI